MPTTTTLQIRVSGTAYEAGLNPLATGVPAEEGWPEPTGRRIGKGWQMTYDLTPQQAARMARHLNVLAAGFAYSDITEAKAEGRAMAAAAAKITKALVMASQQ